MSSGVQLSGPTNSTIFTTCCQTAINDNESRCPRCRELVYPYHDDMTEADRDEIYRDVGNLRWRRAYGPSRF